MPRRRISQKEAREALKEVERLTKALDIAEDRPWAPQVFGTKIATIDVQNAEWHIVNTARKLGRFVAAEVVSGANKLTFFAVKS